MKKQNDNNEPEAETPRDKKRKTPNSGGEREKEGAEPFEERLSEVANAIDEAIENIRGKLAGEDLKPSVSDLVRLIQLRKELTDEAPKQVTVRWVEEWNNSPANEE